MKKITKQMFQKWLSNGTNQEISVKDHNECNPEITEYLKNEHKFHIPTMLGYGCDYSGFFNPQNSDTKLQRAYVTDKIGRYIECNFRHYVQDIHNNDEITDFIENLYCTLTQDLGLEHIQHSFNLSGRFDFDVKEYFRDYDNDFDSIHLWDAYSKSGFSKFDEMEVHDDFIDTYGEFVKNKVQIYRDYFFFVSKKVEDFYLQQEEIVACLPQEVWKTKYFVLCVDFKNEDVFLQKINSDDKPIAVWFSSLDLDSSVKILDLYKSQRKQVLESKIDEMYENLACMTQEEKEELVEEILKETNDE